MVKNVILGAGIAGLSAAYHMKKNYFLAEQEKKIGGLSGSIIYDGFIFDYAEHFLRIPNEWLKSFVLKLMNENIFSQKLYSAIYFKEQLIKYPFQENLRDLPINELKKCANSLILNYFSREKKKKFANFEDFIYYQYGDYIANKFMIPYNEKIWCTKLNEMSTDWFLNQNFLPLFDLQKILDSILPQSKNHPEKKNIRWYPVKGGIEELANSFLPFLSHLALEHKAIKIDIENKVVYFKNGLSEKYKNLISTIPLPELLNIIKPLPSKIKDLTSELKYNSVFCLNFCLNRKIKYNYHWIYFPQKNIPFCRLFFSSNFSKYNVPEGKDSCSALITHLPEVQINEKKYEKESIDFLINLGFLKDKTEIINIIPLRIKYGFPIPTLGLQDYLRIILNFLAKFNIFSISRYGEWKYAGIEHAIEDGKSIVLKLL